MVGRQYRHKQYLAGARADGNRQAPFPLGVTMVCGMRQTRSAMLAAALTTILFAISAVCATRSTRLLGGVVANLSRLVLAALLLGGWAHFVGIGLGGAPFYWFFLSGIVGFGLGDLALYHAFPLLGARLTVLLAQCLAAPFGALVEWVWLGTTLRGSQVFWGLVILLGVSVALAPERSRRLAPHAMGWGILLGVLAAMGQGGGAVLSRKAYAAARLAGQVVDGGTAAYERILGGLVVAGLGLIMAKGIQSRNWKNRALSRAGNGFEIDGWVRHAGPWILANSLAGPVFGVICYQCALAVTPTGLVLAIVATTPLVVMPMALVVEGERFGMRSVVGGLLAVSGAVALAWVR